uniref:helix-turn-helix domain-containing protein n=1 Tax=Lactobacillus taiwanensis TaxID=508451 RepID=UPI002557FF77|nr:helix-turn-helix transcriptional regulator [Lactobacillus taiwanensis]
MSILVFSNRLKYLMQTEKISQRSLSTQTGLQRKSILNWLNAKFYARYDALIKLSDFFGVSSDYLVGHSEESIKIVSSLDFSIESVPKNFKIKLNEFRRKENITKYKLAKNLKIGQSTLARWFEGESMPETAILIRLADLMGESLDYILSRE